MTDDEILDILSKAFSPIELEDYKISVSFKWNTSKALVVQEVHFFAGAIQGASEQTMNATELRTAEVARAGVFAQASARTLRSFYKKTLEETGELPSVTPDYYFFPSLLRRTELTSVEAFETALADFDGIRAELGLENLVANLRKDYPAIADCLETPADALLAESLLDIYVCADGEERADEVLDTISADDRRALAPLLIGFLDISVKSKYRTEPAYVQEHAYEILNEWGLAPSDARERWGGMLETMKALNPGQIAKA